MWPMIFVIFISWNLFIPWKVERDIAWVSAWVLHLASVRRPGLPGSVTVAGVGPQMLDNAAKLKEDRDGKEGEDAGSTESASAAAEQQRAALKAVRANLG